MVEIFRHKKPYVILLFSIFIIFLFLSAGACYEYFFVEDEPVLLFASIGSGVSGIAGLFFAYEIKKFFVEISEKGIKTNRAEITWGMVETVRHTQKGVIVIYEDGGKKRRIGFGSSMEGCDYAKSLADKYISKKEE
jgi:hypothetical protein